MRWFNKVVLEVNSDCNRSCSFCNRHGDSKDRFFTSQGMRISKFMPMKFIESICQQLQQLKWHGDIFFGHMSEPTLDPRIVKVVSIFHSAGFPITFHTNGDVLKKNKKLCRALSQIVDRFVVGIYDVKNKRDIVVLKNWWTQRLAPALTIFSVATTRFQRRFSLGDDKHIGYPTSRCDLPNNNLVIYYDGQVALCCEDINCDFNLGNVFETPIVDIWTSPYRLELVQKLKARRANHPICTACPIVPN